MTAENQPTPSRDTTPADREATGTSGVTEARERILEEAKKLFRQKGFEGVSINAIVDRVGVKKPTIYYYFGDKQGLFVEVLVAMLRHGGDFISANARAGMNVAQKLQKLSEGYLRFCPTSLMAMMRDAQNYLNPTNQQTVLEAYSLFLLKPFERLFQEGIESGEITPNDPRELAIMYLGLIDALTTQKNLLEDRPFNHQAAAELLVDMMFNGIRAKT